MKLICGTADQEIENLRTETVYYCRFQLAMHNLRKTKWTCRVVLLVALHLSCSKYETFEGEIIGFEEKSSIGVPSLVGLKLSPSTARGRELSFKHRLCKFLSLERQKTCTEPALQLGEANLPGLLDHVVSVVADQKQLAAKDLRLGHRIKTEYTPYHKLEVPPVNILNYTAPSRFLRLSLTVSATEGKSFSASKSEFETLLLTHLSWRLPQDVGIVLETDPSENLNVIGEMEVKYFLSEVTTAWQYRDTKVSEFLWVRTRLLDPQARTNWTELKLSGGSEPLGIDASSYSYESAMMKLPMFSVE